MSSFAAELSERLALLRRELRVRHNSGDDPLKVANALADGFGECVVAAWNDARTSIGVPDDSQEVALFAVGGLGRREAAPFSDVDLHVLWTKPSPALEAAVKTTVRTLWDAGFSLGQNVGDVKGLLEQARQDAMVATSLLSMRLLWGSAAVERDLRDGYQKSLAKHGKRAEEQVLELLAEEASRHGAAAQLTEPNVKRSAGGLRFIHGIEWVGRLRTGAESFEAMEQVGFLASGDAGTLFDAKRWLIRVRTDLHFAAGKAEDVLTRSEQLRISGVWGYQDSPDQLGVERFMREVLRRTTAVQEIAEDVFFRPSGSTRRGRWWPGAKNGDETAAPPTLEAALEAAVAAVKEGRPLSQTWTARLRRHFRPPGTARTSLRHRWHATGFSPDGPARSIAAGVRDRPLSHPVQRLSPLHRR
jgi:[protein-PII] uridylyltransferase